MKKTAALYGAFAAAVLFLFFFKIGEIPLWSSDEGRHGAIARGMLETRNFILPHFNGIEYLHKPAFATMLSAFSQALFGFNSFATRLPTVLAALAGILMTYGFSRRLFGKRVAEVCAVILSTSVGYVLVGRFAVIDMLMTFFLDGAVFCLMAARFSEKKRMYFAAYALMGFAFLTKGLIGFLLPGLIFFVFLLWTRGIGEVGRMSLGRGLLIFLAVVLPWSVAVTVQEPDFFKVFILENHFGRFTSGVYGRHRPFWFFVPVFFGLMFPWSLFVPAAVAEGMKKTDDAREKIRFLLCWIGVIFVFFSIPSSKLPYYLLPISIPSAILTAVLFVRWFDAADRNGPGRLALWLWRSVVFVCAGAFAGLAGYLLIGKKTGEVTVLEPLLWFGAFLLPAGGFAAYRFYRKGRPVRAFGGLALMVYTGLLAAVIGMERITPYQSTEAFARLVRERLRPGDTAAILGSPDRFSDFFFYLGRKVVVVGTDRGSLGAESLEADQAETAEAMFLDLPVFIELFNARQRRLFCLIEEKKFGRYRGNRGFELEERGLKEYFVLKKDSGKLLFSNFP